VPAAEAVRDEQAEEVAVEVTVSDTEKVLEVVVLIEMEGEGEGVRDFDKIPEAVPVPDAHADTQELAVGHELDVKELKGLDPELEADCVMAPVAA